MNYWLDNVSGNDGNDGLSKVNAWATFNTKSMAVLQYGDTLTIVKTGTTYNEAGGFALAAFAGTPSNGVTIQGEDPTDPPTMSATGQGTHIMDCNTQDYIAFLDVIFSTADSTWDGVIFDQCNNFTIQRCRVTATDNALVNDSSISVVNILDCEIDNNRVRGYDDSGDVTIGLVFKRNYVHDNTENAIDMDDCDSAIISENRMIDNGDHCIEIDASTNQRNSDITIEDNYIKDWGASNQAIRCRGITDFSIRRNYFTAPVNHGDATIMIRENGSEATAPGDGTIGDNVIYNTGSSGNDHAMFIWGANGNDANPINIYNNTIYDLQGSGSDAIHIRMTSLDTIGDPVINVFNNILQSIAGYGISMTGDYVSGTPTVNYDYNNYYNITSGNVEDPNGWAAGTHTNDITTDPAMANPAGGDPSSGDFDLLPSSPCRGAGDPTIARDIGAHQYYGPDDRRRKGGRFYRGPSSVNEILQNAGPR